MSADHPTDGKLLIIESPDAPTDVCPMLGSLLKKGNEEPCNTCEFAVPGRFDRKVRTYKGIVSVLCTYVSPVKEPEWPPYMRGCRDLIPAIMSEEQYERQRKEIEALRAAGQNVFFCGAGCGIRDEGECPRDNPKAPCSRP